MARRSSKTRPKAAKPRSIDRGDAKIKKWNRAPDIPMDEEDEFHASRDHILLDSENQYIEGDEYMDDEVFALKGMDDDESEQEDVEEEDDENDALVEETSKPDKQRNKTKKKADKAEGTSSNEKDNSEGEEEIWGRGKHAYYADNADELESDDEEANEMEEQEARRLQSKTREDMVDTDFGLDDNPDIVKPEVEDLLEAAPEANAELPQDKKALLRHLEKTNPETLALARDWEDSVYAIQKTKDQIKSIEANDPNNMSLGMVHLYYQTLLTYATALAFYFCVRASPQYTKAPGSLRSHPIMSRLLTLKQALSTMEDLDFAPEDFDDDESSSYGDYDEIEREIWGDILGRNDPAVGKLDAGELADLLADAGYEPDLDQTGEELEPPKKKRKKSTKDRKSNSWAQAMFDLIEPDFMPSKKSKQSVPDSLADPYGEATTLQHADAADKSARKKSLRFHTSKVESASAKRKCARDRAMGGDDDIPYRGRRKEREALLGKEARAKGLGQGGEDLDDDEPPSKLVKRSDEATTNEHEDMADVNGYYELVKKVSKDKKERKKAEYEAANARPDFEEDDVNGPRSLTRAILANKGLTPHRPKSVRNPRVKKRLKFEKAKKKLSSQKAVYKGGVASNGRYDGEKSGISKVVKSIRLG